MEIAQESFIWPSELPLPNEFPKKFLDSIEFQGVHLIKAFRDNQYFLKSDDRGKVEFALKEVTRVAINVQQNL